MYKKRWQQKLENLDSAFLRLSEALDREHFDELEKDGVIQRFEFTFEFAWKTIKDYLEDQGFIDIASPKKVLRMAFKESLFEDGDIWMNMLTDRNSLSHLYKQEMSDTVFENIKDKYKIELKELICKLKKEI